MVRLTKENRKKILNQNNGFTTNTSYDSRNSKYGRRYEVKEGELHICESGKTSWADSGYKKEWVASDEEVHRFLYNNKRKMNMDGLN